MMVQFSAKADPDSPSIKYPRVTITAANGEEIARIAAAMVMLGKQAEYPTYLHLASEMLTSLLLHSGKQGYDLSLARAHVTEMLPGAEEILEGLEEEVAAH